jgi:hypothetical protein
MCPHVSADAGSGGLSPATIATDERAPLTARRRRSGTPRRRDRMVVEAFDSRYFDFAAIPAAIEGPAAAGMPDGW